LEPSHSAKNLNENRKCSWLTGMPFSNNIDKNPIREGGIHPWYSIT
jgi:hypothetical protein